MTHREFRDFVRLDEAQRAALLGRLNSVSEQESNNRREMGRDHRSSKRYDYPRAALPIAVEHPAGGFATLMMCARNLSSGGIGLIHGGFLHANTRCMILLETVDGERISIEGAVVSSRHIQGSLHEISIRFTYHIDVSRFMTAEERRKTPSSRKAEMEPELTDRFRAIVQELREAIDAASLDGIRALCHEIAALPGIEDQESLAAEAARLIALLDEPGPIDDAIAEVRALADMCAALIPRD